MRCRHSSGSASETGVLGSGRRIVRGGARLPFVNARLALVLSMLALAACAEDESADASDSLEVGGDGPPMFPSNLDGDFTGTLEGTVSAELTNETFFRVLLIGPSLMTSGEGTIDGDLLDAVLTTADDPMFGRFTGTLDGDSASGEWSLATPAMDSGTWTALRE